MVVYILIRQRDYDKSYNGSECHFLLEPEILGVYSNKEMAEKEIKDLPREIKDLFNVPMIINYIVEEWKVMEDLKNDKKDKH